MSWLHLRQLQTNLKEVFVLLFWRNSTWMHQTGHWITKLSIFTSKEEVKTLEWILRLNWSLTGNVALFIWRKNWKQQEQEKKKKKQEQESPSLTFCFLPSPFLDIILLSTQQLPTHPSQPHSGKNLKLFV